METISKKSIFNQAWAMVKSLKISISEALKRVWKGFKSLNLVEKAKNLATFKICFTKKETGELVERIGQAAKEKDGKLLFFSLTDGGFRQAIIENIVSISPITVKIVTC